ncbi:MAG TPA: hypothetical protein VLA61_16285 [Ideonella sp.]|uniref:hypothetical protein n=1 Tax=Ideonella sp. TaxID=1929293 RepID=UPI002D1A03DE|nr:hypothetical protein [Ideonella sp.]HSI49831.1 hypothetical protein [Ideonella sp.]
MNYLGMRHILPLLLTMTTIAVGHAASQAKPQAQCRLTDEAFDSVLRRVGDWRTIDAFHRKHFPQCLDDGYYSEGYSDLIVHTLASRWDTLPVLAEVTRRRPAFLKFVLRHIDASTDPTQLRAIQVDAASACPAAQRQLCAAIGGAAKSALMEIAVPVPPAGEVSSVF